ncbi:ABC transporter substrate-binding protein [Nesterenkonia ebinurensis]|uniref:ABC transporter substrate-binding protein n=1 Tax=Nesterenkonia ebinurensis TaxID=2608252 RepID=UPI00123CAFB0|nr:ABC transporter substrate-binding protein [Nesterenkonia ebinurensis]
MKARNSHTLRRTTISGLAIGSLFALSACDAVTEGGEDDGTGAAGTGSNELIIGFGRDIDTVDTHNSADIATEAIMVNVQDYLIRRDDDGTLQPHLAETYENIDEQTWSFTLHEGITFHNGDPLTSEDVKFTLERVSSDDTLAQYANYNTIAEVNVIDELNFEIVTDGPDPVLPYRLAREGSGIFPKNYIEEEGWEGYMEHPVGSGAFEFVEWSEGENFTISRYEDYFRGDVTEWDTVEFRIIGEDSTRISELLTGGVHIADFIPMQDLDRVDAEEGIDLLPTTTTTVQRIYVNANEGNATEDPLVREALDYAIDNETMNDMFQNGEGVPTRTALVPGAFGFEESLHDSFRYDPDRARELLEEAGYGEGELEITVNQSQGRSPDDADMAQAVAGMLEEVGIEAQLNLMEASQYVDSRNNGEFNDLLHGMWNNTFYDGSFSLGHFHSDYHPEAFGYDNPEVDELLEAAAVNMDEEEREEQYQQVQEIVAEELPYIYLYQQVTFRASAEGINYEPRADDMVYVEYITAD